MDCSILSTTLFWLRLATVGGEHNATIATNIIDMKIMRFFIASPPNEFRLGHDIYSI
jgi:hypothetical protein